MPVLARVVGLAVVVVFSCAADAADPSLLSGTVTSKQEGPMEGVLVTAQREGSPVAVTVVSDAKGHFQFPSGRLHPGPHAVRIRATGYDLAGPSKITIDASSAANVTVNLKPTA